LLIKYFFISNVPIIIFERTINSNSVPTLYTPCTYFFESREPRTEANGELCDYVTNYKAQKTTKFKTFKNQSLKISRNET